MTNDELAIHSARVLDEGRKMQQHRLEKIVKNHLLDIVNTPADYCKTPLEIAMREIVRQFIDGVKAEQKNLVNFDSIYLKG